MLVCSMVFMSSYSERGSKPPIHITTLLLLSRSVGIHFVVMDGRTDGRAVGSLGAA